MPERSEANVIRDNEQVYDEQVAPLMGQIIAICREHKIPFVASFEYAPEMLCTTVQPQEGQTSRLEIAASLIVRGHAAFMARATDGRSS